MHGSNALHAPALWIGAQNFPIRRNVCHYRMFWTPAWVCVSMDFCASFQYIRWRHYLARKPSSDWKFASDSTHRIPWMYCVSNRFYQKFHCEKFTVRSFQTPSTLNVLRFSIDSQISLWEICLTQMTFAILTARKFTKCHKTPSLECCVFLRYDFFYTRKRKMADTPSTCFAVCRQKKSLELIRRIQ